MVVTEEGRLFCSFSRIREHLKENIPGCSQNFFHVAKYLKDNKHNSLYYALKHALMFVLGHNLFLEAHNFPRPSLSENCSVWNK